MLDVDGVLTDGRIIVGADGSEHKCFDAHDGYGITRAIDSGLRLLLLSGRKSKSVEHRAAELGITDLYQDTADKLKLYQRIRSKYVRTDREVCFVGDDEFDLPLLRLVGWSAAPADAIEVVRHKVDYVTRAGGGRGAVREILDMILRAQNIVRP